MNHFMFNLLSTIRHAFHLWLEAAEQEHLGCRKSNRANVNIYEKVHVVLEEAFMEGCIKKSFPKTTNSRCKMNHFMFNLFSTIRHASHLWLEAAE
jgi:hypothetical protein